MALSQEQLQQIRQSYQKEETQQKSEFIGLDKVIANMASQEQEDKGFFGRAKEALSRRGSALQETAQLGAERGGIMGRVESIREGEVPLLPGEEKLRVAGDVVGAIGDVIGAALEPALAPTIEWMAGTEVGKAAFDKMTNTIEEYEAWKTESPTNERVGKAIESIINVSDLAGASAAGKTTVKQSLGLLGRGARGVREGAERVVPDVAAGAGRVASEAIGAGTGVGEEAFVEAFKNPNVIKFARAAGKKGAPDLIEEALTDAEKGVRKIVENKNNEYVSRLAELDLKQDLSPSLLEVNRVASELQDQTRSIVKGKRVVDRAISTVSEWDDVTATGLDDLKKILGQYSEQLKAPGNAPAKRIVDELYNTTRKQLEQNVEGYAEMTAGYAKSKQLLDDIRSSLSITGDVQRRETAARKLIQTMRRDKDLRKDLIQELEIASGQDISAKLAGSMLGDFLPQGIGRRLAVPGALLTAMNPGFLAALLPFIPLMSPRVAAEITSLAGSITKKMFKENKLPKSLEPQARSVLNAILEESGGVGAVGAVEAVQDEIVE